jgi:hypothetical protein
VNSRIRYLLLLTGFTVAIVQCGAQQQTQSDHDAVKAKSEVIFVQPLTGDSNTSKIVTNQLFLKSMSGFMSYDVRIGLATGIVPLRLDSGVTNRGASAGARSWRLGIEQAERINVMQMNEYRQRATLQNAGAPTLTPPGVETIFNAK